MSYNLLKKDKEQIQAQIIIEAKKANILHPKEFFHA